MRGRKKKNNENFNNQKGIMVPAKNHNGIVVPLNKTQKKFKIRWGCRKRE